MVHSLDPPGRFLKKNEGSGDWEEVTDKEATQRAWQALRDARAPHDPPPLPPDLNDDVSRLPLLRGTKELSVFL